MVGIHVGPRVGDVATVLLHGAAGSWTTWMPLIAASARSGSPLSDLVLIDLPGWGDSPGPVPSPAVLACVVADVVRAAGYERWVIVGHSLGGVVALDVAARFPDRTLGVGLVSPSGASVRDAVRRPVRGGIRLPMFAGMLLAMRFLRLLGRGAQPLLRFLRRTRMLRLLAAPLFRVPVETWVSDALADEIRPASFVEAATHAADEDLSLWRRIRVPVRSVRGRRDVFARTGDDAFLVHLIPQVHVDVLPDAGHFAHIERPDETLAALSPVLTMSGVTRDPDQAGGVGIQFGLAAGRVESAAAEFALDLDLPPRIR